MTNPTDNNQKREQSATVDKSPAERAATEIVDRYYPAHMIVDIINESFTAERAEAELDKARISSLEALIRQIIEQLGEAAQSHEERK